MAQQQIITKPYVGELQDDDSLFINHDGALRQVKKKDADFASSEYVRTYVDNVIKARNYAFAITKGMMDDQLASVGIPAPLTYPYAKMLMAHADHYYGDGYQCVNVLAMAEVINALCEQIDANTSNISGKADSATTLSGYGITDAYTKTETYTKEEVGAALEDKANHKYNQNANVLGVTKTTEQIGDKQVVFKKGGIFGGTAAEAGLVTRGICGITSPDENGGCTKEHLYINYDGDSSYSRKLVLGAGTTGSAISATTAKDSYGMGHMYSAVRGDQMVNYVRTYVDNAIKAITDGNEVSY